MDCLRHFEPFVPSRRWLLAEAIQHIRAIIEHVEITIQSQGVSLAIDFLVELTEILGDVI